MVDHIYVLPSHGSHHAPSALLHGLRWSVVGRLLTCSHDRHGDTDKVPGGHPHRDRRKDLGAQPQGAVPAFPGHKQLPTVAQEERVRMPARDLPPKKAETLTGANHQSHEQRAMSPPPPPLPWV